MNTIEYDLFKGQYINRFVTTGTYTKPQKFKRATLSGKVNEWLDKGFAIHENPCRKEFIAERQKLLPPYVDLDKGQDYGTIETFGQVRKPQMYFPFGNIGYDASFFYKCPTYLRTYCYVDLEMPQEEMAELELETCGGMTLWNNGSIVADFIPFTRNLVKRRSISVQLKEGKNHLVICLDDLAERDTDYYFRIRYCGNQRPKILLPVPENTEPEQIKRCESILDGLYFTKESYREEPVCISVPSGNVSETGEDSLVMLVGNGGALPTEDISKEPVEALLAEGKVQKKNVFRYQLQADRKCLALLPSSDVLPGFTDFLFEMRAGDATINRRIGCQIVWECLQKRGADDIETRRKAFLDVLCAYGKDDVYKAAAILKTGRDVKKAEGILRNALKGINAREDCSDFAFIVVLYIYHIFKDLLSQEILEQIEDAAVNYRYWIDEPGDDVMWFFSENHALLFHICQYLAGSFFPERYFTNSGRTGTEVKAHGEMLLNEWFDAFFEEFVTEWNSNAYIPIDVHGFGFLYNLTAEGTPFHEKAKKALDMVAYSITVNSHKGVVMTSFGRTYEKELKGNDNTGITALLYILYNEGHLNRDGAGSIALALSDYEAPEEYRAYIDPGQGKHMIFMNTQGYEQHVNLYLYKDQDTVLSTAVQYKPFKKGYQEHIVQAAIDSTAQVFINHPGEVQPYGSGRPNFWAGNGELPYGVQEKDMAVLIYRISEENRIDFTHAYAPLSEFETYIVEKDLAVLEKNRAYIGVKAEQGLSIVTEGATAYRELVSPGRNNIWVLCVGTEKEYGSLEGFREKMKAVKICRQSGQITVSEDNRKLSVADDGTYTVNGEPAYHYPLTPEGIVTIHGAGGNYE